MASAGARVGTVEEFAVHDGRVRVVAVDEAGRLTVGVARTGVRPPEIDVALHHVAHRLVGPPVPVGRLRALVEPCRQSRPRHAGRALLEDLVYVAGARFVALKLRSLPVRAPVAEG